jgi:hypothetical protein
MEAEVEEYLRRRYEDVIANVVRVAKEDLRMVSHEYRIYSNPSPTTFSVIVGRFSNCSFKMFPTC